MNDNERAAMVFEQHVVVQTGIGASNKYPNWYKKTLLEYAADMRAEKFNVSFDLETYVGLAAKRDEPTNNPEGWFDIFGVMIMLLFAAAAWVVSFFWGFVCTAFVGWVFYLNINAYLKRVEEFDESIELYKEFFQPRQQQRNDHDDFAGSGAGAKANAEPENDEFAFNKSRFNDEKTASRYQKWKNMANDPGASESERMFAMRRMISADQPD